MQRRQHVAIFRFAFGSLVKPTRKGRFITALLIDDTRAAHCYDRPLEIFQRVADFKDPALQLDLKFAVVLSEVLQDFNLFVEGIDQKWHEDVLVVSDRAGISHDHHELIFLHAAHRQCHELLWLERHVAGRIRGRLAIGAHITPEEGEIAVMAWPFEIIRVTAKEPDILWWRINDANIIQCERREKIIGLAFIERQNRRRYPVGRLGIAVSYGRRIALNRGVALRRRHGIGDALQHIGSDIF